MTQIALRVDADDYAAAVNRAASLARKLRKALERIERTPIVVSVVVS